MARCVYNFCHNAPQDVDLNRMFSVVREAAQLFCAASLVLGVPRQEFVDVVKALGCKSYVHHLPEGVGVVREYLMNLQQVISI